MKGHELLDKMELIDSHYVEAAERCTMPSPIHSRKWIAAVACICLVALGTFILWKGSLLSPVQENLVAIRVPELQPAAMGYEEYCLREIVELSTGNPWTEASNFSILPVFQNKAYDRTHAGVPTGLKEKDMFELLQSTALALGATVTTIEKITEDTGLESNRSFTQNLTSLEAETNLGRLSVEANGEINYFLPEDFTLPEEYRFSGRNGKKEQDEKTLAYLLSNYQKMLAFQNPRVFSESKGQDTFGSRLVFYKAYDKGDNHMQAFLNYHFASAEFLWNERGNLTAIRIKNDLRAAEKLGDYPIITAEQAIKRLENGYYQTNAPFQFKDKKDIAKIELMYRSGPMEEMLLPYYRFYVLLQEENGASGVETGLKTYGAYYVPAIHEEYLTEMPVYGGEFN